MKALFWKLMARFCGLIVALKLEEARHAANLDTWSVARHAALRWDHRECNCLRRAQGFAPVALSAFEQRLIEKGMSADLARIAGRSL